MDRHWWFRGRRAAVNGLLTRARVPLGGDVLDVGCGPGHMGAALARYGRLTGVDSSAEAFELGDHSAYARVLRAAGPADPAFPAGPFTLIACLDVLEHVGDDAGFLAALAALLAPAGRLVASVPLRPELLGPTDVSAGHFRRYTPESLREALAAAGLEVTASTGYVVALLPLAVAHRRRVAAGRSAEGLEHRVPPAPLNAAASAVAVAEGALARWVALPPGLSEIVVARRG